jgi:hypothetical protein
MGTVAAPASAQRRPIEFGTDAMVAFQEVPGTNDFWEVNGPIGGILSFVPLQGFRVGFFLSDRFSFEPSIGFNYLSDDEGDDMSRLGLSSTLQLQLSDGLSGPFVGVGGSYGRLSGDGESAYQFGTHALVGGRALLTSNLYFRASGGAGYSFENDDFNQRWTYFGTVGLSYVVGGPTSVAMGNR